MKKNIEEHILRFFQNRSRVISIIILVCLLGNLVAFTVVSSTISDIAPSIPLTTSSQRGGWELVESGVAQDLNSIFFVCLNRGTVVGDEGIILRTGDGGDNWTAQTTGVIADLSAVSYFGYTITLAVGGSGTLLYTNNSGQNWTVLQTGMMETYHSCQMITETIGVAVGVNAIFQPFFTRTYDGWSTWDSSSFYIENDSVYYEGWLSDVYFINSSFGFATAVVDVPAGGAVVRTTDGGTTWETAYFSDKELYSIDFYGEQFGCAVGTDGAVVRTLNGGETWQELNSGVETVLRGVDFSSEPTGIIIGDDGLILRTENQGLSWRQQTSGTAEDLLGIQCITNLFGFVVGKNGIILRTQTGGYPEDTTPPETTCTLSGTIEDGVYLSDVTVTLHATDNISGVATTLYKLDDAAWETYDDSFVVSTDGDHLLQFYSIDYVGNMEQEKTSEFIIHHPPNLTITVTGGFGIQVHIKNLETEDLTNVPWNLTIEGGLILLGKQKSGEINITSGEERTLNSLVLGFGKPTILFTIASCQKSVQSRVFLVFVRI